MTLLNFFLEVKDVVGDIAVAESIPEEVEHDAPIQEQAPVTNVQQNTALQPMPAKPEQKGWESVQQGYFKVVKVQKKEKKLIEAVEQLKRQNGNDGRGIPLAPVLFVASYSPMFMI